jgi:hypothetical protein
MVRGRHCSAPILTIKKAVSMGAFVGCAKPDRQ